MSEPQVTEEKRALRTAMKSRLGEVSSGELEWAGRRVMAHLEPLLDVALASRPGAPVALFASMGHEISTFPLDDRLRKAGVRRLYPTIADDGSDLVFRSVGSELAVDAFPLDSMGIPTPPSGSVPTELLEAALVIVPGLGFDLRGGRVGYGRGYYDRALRRMRGGGAPPMAVGIALDIQVVEVVPMGDTDQLLNGLCTPKGGLIRFS